MFFQHKKMNWGHTMTNFMLKVQLETPQMPHNLLGTKSAIIWNFLKKKKLITCPLSMGAVIVNRE